MNLMLEICEILDIYSFGLYLIVKSWIFSVKVVCVCKNENTFLSLVKIFL